MAAALEEKIGLKLTPATFKVESGKIKEFALAIGDLKEEYLSGEKVPPTFPTVIDFWSEGDSTSALLGVNMEKVLHGGQEYEYLAEIKAGDEITITGEVENVYSKASMNFFVIKKEYVNQNGETVLIAKSTIIERH
ncbi:FAS1-like dehydratase domain-containing protein [Cytobacillus horneckiae]|uniref:FAS1-like dehydratase domain-containing protein n=1 Tax=Cytobacillus horneckiae TaxID=549687 RepID=A0A2N0ZLJ0_9BACI|nr:MaoC family dehydratase N-terminal domain-containing protein [Cytobacillus horneckiae]MCM3177349.1 MaoC family dehydratase N-terminal domain-containing protein [Cytobacillus horneckiae]MEC1156087.1 MaoC family dehydratase N-terminal domain-containing protein [Cytobacillus horneckiae]MED2937447.1 MaoC family dehydratase N-terminal domain-containing protein [Cytobacillus horneckiae]PKG30369.1 hypothetical protein CWS20_05090 [Cytobacillus horneckiae]